MQSSEKSSTTNPSTSIKKYQSIEDDMKQAHLGEYNKAKDHVPCVLPPEINSQNLSSPAIHNITAKQTKCQKDQQGPPPEMYNTRLPGESAVPCFGKEKPTNNRTSYSTISSQTKHDQNLNLEGFRSLSTASTESDRSQRGSNPKASIASAQKYNSFSPKQESGKSFDERRQEARNLLEEAEKEAKRAASALDALLKGTKDDFTPTQIRDSSMPLSMDDINDPNVMVTEYVVMQPKRKHNEKMRDLSEEIQKSLLSSDRGGLTEKLKELEAAAQEEEENIVPVGGRLKLQKVGTSGGGKDKIQQELERERKQQESGATLVRSLSTDPTEYEAETRPAGGKK